MRASDVCLCILMFISINIVTSFRMRTAPYDDELNESIFSSIRYAMPYFENLQFLIFFQKFDEKSMKNLYRFNRKFQNINLPNKWTIPSLNHISFFWIMFFINVLKTY